jgi:hypothetical protein
MPLFSVDYLVSLKLLAARGRRRCCARSAAQPAAVRLRAQAHAALERQVFASAVFETDAFFIEIESPPCPATASAFSTA